MKQGFSTEKYLEAQKKAIEERLAKFSGRLYLEFGGKLLDDFHAARTLPGYDPNAKLTLLKSLKQNLEVLYCISAKQLQDGKLRGDWGVDYEEATVRSVAQLVDLGLPVTGVVINRFEEEAEAEILKNRLERKGIPVYFRAEIEGYPNNLEQILSSRGYGKDDYIKTSKPLVVVWGAGPGSGKMSTCLGQIYLDAQKGLNSGYAKFETFPVWDLPLNHPVNVAYEASTADLGDYNLIDPFHLKAYGKTAINYNRDVDSFPIIKRIFEKLLGKENFSRSYQSPTDMGFNVLSQGISDEVAVVEAAKREVIFYLFRYRQEYLKGLGEEKVLERMDELLKKLSLTEEDLKIVPAARKARIEAEKEAYHGYKGIFCGAAIELPDGRIVVGKNSAFLHAEAAAFLNAIKTLAGIPDEIDIIAEEVVRSINDFKKEVRRESSSLDCSEAFLALAVSSKTNPLAQKAQKYLPKLRNCFMHTTHEPSLADQALLRKLPIWVSTDGMGEKTFKNVLWE